MCVFVYYYYEIITSRGCPAGRVPHGECLLGYWPMAFNLCPTHCSPINAILPDPRTLDDPSSRLVSHLYIKILLLLLLLLHCCSPQLYQYYH